uniref:Uncharacterized protein n=1 Tax=Aegilops tauschii subsp. strangulata TaxID=200361 RepID=A0A453LLD9_AEGTS
MNIIWSSMLIWANFHEAFPSTNLSLEEWWDKARSRLQGDKKRALNSLVILVVWSIWRERNRRVFGVIHTPIQHVIDQIK